MTSENLSTAEIPTRLDASQGDQVPLSASFGVSFDTVYPTPTMYQIPGVSRPPFGSLPNATHPLPTSFSADLYSGGASFVPTNQGQGAIYTSANLTPSFISAPPSFSIELYGAAAGASFAPNYQGQMPVFPPTIITPCNNVHLQESFNPFDGVLPSDGTAGFLQLENSGRDEQVFPPFRWPLPMQQPAAATQQQAQYHVAQDLLTQPPQEPSSVNREDYQTNVAFHAALSAPEECPQHDQLENQPRSSLPAENTPPKSRRKVQTNASKYYCERCDKWVYLHRRKKHDKTHEGDYVCRICEVLQWIWKPLSRKDALKRHINKKHPEFRHLLGNLALRLLVPRRTNEHEDLEELRQAMFPE